MEDYEGWAIVEMMGHRRLGGYVSEALVAGSPMLRIDVYDVDGDVPAATQFVGAGSIYALTPSSQEAARRTGGTIAPVARWELPEMQALPAAASTIDRRDEVELDDDDLELEVEHVDPHAPSWAGPAEEGYPS